MSPQSFIDLASFSELAKTCNDFSTDVSGKKRRDNHAIVLPRSPSQCARQKHSIQRRDRTYNLFPERVSQIAQAVDDSTKELRKQQGEMYRRAKNQWTTKVKERMYLEWSGRGQAGR